MSEVGESCETSLKAIREPIESLDTKARLLKRQQRKEHFDRNLTFSPKLNETSVKLARRRSENFESYQERQKAFIAANRSRFEREYTFKPAVSEKSLLIVEKLGSTFLLRQQKHLEKKQKLQEDAYKRSPPFKPTINRSKGISTKSVAVSQGSSGSRHGFCDAPRRVNSVIGSYSESDNLPECPPVANVTGRSVQLQVHGSHGPHPGTPSDVLRVGHIKERDRHVRLRTSPGLCSDEKDRSVANDNQHRKRSLTVSLPIKPKYTAVNCVDHIRLKKIKAKADELLKSKKVFVVRGPYKAIRCGLRQRGWVERDYCKGARQAEGEQASNPQQEGDCDHEDVNEYLEESSDEEFSDEEEYCLLSRAIRNSIPYFIWTIKREQDLYTCLRKDQTANHIKGSGAFTTKVGLCTNLQEASWLGDVDTQTFFPRCYRLSCDEDKECFIDDYRLTAAMSILKIATDSRYQLAPVNDSGVVLPKCVVSLAIRACQVYLNALQHVDIEGSSTWLVRPLGEAEWSKLQLQYTDITRFGGCIETDDDILTSCTEILGELKCCYPQLLVDGVHNVWIVKPGALSRGRGISCMNQLNDILELVSGPTQKKEGRWIVQKYIEHPLLVYETKFDIRQWFLVSSWNPLTMWMYKDSYLRFSSRPYNLKDMDRSIHLCNNSVQRHEENVFNRSDQLPADNMWYHTQFISYLNQIGHNGSELWSTVVFPGMRDAIVHVLQASMDVVEPQSGRAFELFGADFILSEDCKPWLIEVNSSPSMAYSTHVTKTLCRAVQEDALKVMVDRSEDKVCSTGQFEMAYKHPKLDTAVSLGIKMAIEGSAIPKPSPAGKSKQQ